MDFSTFLLQDYMQGRYEYSEVKSINPLLPDPSQIEFPETPQEALIRQLHEDIEEKVVAIGALSEQIGKLKFIFFNR